MALTTTTLNGAVALTDSSITLTSATGLVAGMYLFCDGEWMVVAKDYTSGTTVNVLRGRDGSAQAAHVTGANISFGNVSDFANSGAPSLGAAINVPNVMTTTMTSYSAAGAIAFGVSRWTTAIIDGTNALAMTLANPTKDQDGIMLLIVGNGKAAHTVTYTAGLGNGGSNLDVLTCATGAQQSLLLVAANAIWVQVPSVLAGTLTNITITAS